MSLDYLRGWKASFLVSTRKLSHWALGHLWRVKNGLSHQFRLHTCCGLAVPWFAGALNHHFIPLQEVTVHSEVSHMSHPQGAVGTLELTSRCCSGAEHLLTVEHPPFQMRGSHFVCQLHLPHLSWRDPTSVVWGYWSPTYWRHSQPLTRKDLPWSRLPDKWHRTSLCLAPLLPQTQFP